MTGNKGSFICIPMQYIFTVLNDEIFTEYEDVLTKPKYQFNKKQEKYFLMI